MNNQTPHSNTPHLPHDLDHTLVANSFNKVAPHYAKHALLQHQVARSLSERLDDLALTPLKIADIGCGSGGLCTLISQQYPSADLYAVDIAPQMVAIAQQQCQRSNNHFLCANSQQIPFASQQFDVVASNLMLQWCSDYSSVLREFKRILKPQGVLLFSSLGPDTLQELKTSWTTVDDYTHINAFVDLHDLGDQLVQHGFQMPVLDIDRLTYHYPDAWSVMRSLKNVGAHNLNAGRSRTLYGKNKLAAVINAYEKYRQADGLPVTYEVIYGYAVAQSPQQTQIDGSVHISMNVLKKP